MYNHVSKMTTAPEWYSAKSACVVPLVMDASTGWFRLQSVHVLIRSTQSFWRQPQ